MRLPLLLSLLSFSLIAKAQIHEAFKDSQGKYGFKDAAGKVLVQPKFDSAFIMTNGFGYVSVGQNPTRTYGVVDLQGKEIIPAIYKMFYSSGDDFFIMMNDKNKFAYLDRKGKAITPFKYDSPYPFVEGRAGVNVGKLVDDDFFLLDVGKWGFIDTTGKEVIPLKYSVVQNFVSGLAAVAVGGQIDEGTDIINARWGYVNAEGVEVVPPKYQQVFGFYEGLSAVQLNGKQGYIDATGKVVIPLKYDLAEDFLDGLARVNIGGWMNEEGEFTGGKYGLIDKTGKEITPLKYNELLGFSEGLAIVEAGGKFGFINEKGEEVIPLKYDDVRHFKNGVAFVGFGIKPNVPLIEGKWGIIDRSGKEVVPAKFDWVGSDFEDNLALVKLTGKFYFIDNKGTIVRPFTLPENYQVYPIDAFGRFKVEKIDKSEVYYIDKEGKKTDYAGKVIQ